MSLMPNGQRGNLRRDRPQEERSIMRRMLVQIRDSMQTRRDRMNDNATQEKVHPIWGTGRCPYHFDEPDVQESQAQSAEPVPSAH